MSRLLFMLIKIMTYVMVVRLQCFYFVINKEDICILVIVWHDTLYNYTCHEIYGMPLRVMVQSTARNTIHLQFNISAIALDIRAVQSPRCIVWRAAY
jgi:hypothetical protein